MPNSISKGFDYAMTTGIKMMIPTRGSESGCPDWNTRGWQREVDLKLLNVVFYQRECPERPVLMAVPKPLPTG